MKIIIADDDRLVCSSLKTIVEAGGMEVAGVAHGGGEAVALYEKARPDIVLMDIRMGDMTGLEAGRRILALDPAAKILFLTTFADDEYIVTALKMGAKGYLLKQDFESIVPALTSVALGQSIFGDGVVNKLPEILGRAEQKQPEPPLSERERSILAQIAEGRSNREIAAKLYLSEGTVRNYISAMLDKLEMRDRTQLAIYYYKHLPEE